VSGAGVVGFDLAGVEGALAAVGVPAVRLEVGAGAHVVVSSWGGRVYGPFFDGGAPANWLPPEFGDVDALRGLVARGAWNVGGDRVWIGPEIAYMVSDRSDYWGSYEMPPSLDPGRHDLALVDDAAVLDSTATLHAHTAPEGGATADLRVRVAAAPHPLRHLRLGDDDRRRVDAVGYAGYRTEVRLAFASEGRQEAESWLLDQVPGGGTAFVGATPGVQVTDYYEPVGDLLSAVPGAVAVELPGDTRFKVGFAAPQVTGRVAHVRALPGGRALAFVRSSPVDPSAEYSEEPDPSPGVRGDALHLYDDDGGLGGFAEVEARGTPVVGPAPEAVTDTFASWWFRGAPDDVARVVEMLVGVPAATVAAACSTPPPSPDERTTP
jgi:hypothetical protein